jgi:hypothetical protein
LNFGSRYVVVNDFAEDAGFAHAAGYQLGVLRTKVND